MASRQINRKPPGPDDPRHGQYRGYIAGCRCAPCVQAELDYQHSLTRMKAYGIPRKVPTLGVARKLQALMAIGWSGEYLADRLGVRRSNMPTSAKYPTVRKAFADKVDALYSELCETAGPSVKTKARAKAAGWLPPAEYVERSTDDLRALIRRAEELGTPPAITQRYLKISPETYSRLREETHAHA